MSVLKYFMIVILLPVAVCFAIPSISLNDKDLQKIDREKSRSFRKSMEEKLSDLERQARTTTKSMDKSAQESVRDTAQAMKTRTIDMDMPLQNPFMDIIARWESQGKNPFSEIRVITRPKLDRDFGLTAEIRPGMIDNHKAAFLRDAASSNMYLSTIPGVREADVKRYMKNVAWYGCLIAQGFLNLQQAFADIGVETSNQSGQITAEIAYDDFLILVEGALIQVGQNGFADHIKRFFDGINADIDQMPCQFDTVGAQPDRIRCGRVSLQISGTPHLFAQGREVYGDSCAGLKGSFKFSSGLSWQAAIENLKSTTSAKRFAEEVSKSSENLLSQGRAKEAVMIRKKAWEAIAEASSGLNVSQ